MDFALTEQEYQKFKIRTLEFKIDQMVKTLNDETVTAKIENGIIKGSKRLTIYNKPYYSFEQIPYAEPPVGALRFQAPVPKTSWQDVRDCTWYGPKAMQRNPMDPTSIEGSEDCLFVNVYTNNLKPFKPRPVMVWVHGGGFYFGEANREWTGPDYFMEKDVILITIQYRLGALGKDKPIEELLPKAWSNSIPLILGSNSLEGLYFERAAVKNESQVLKTLETCTNYVPKHAANNIDSPEAKVKGLKLRKIHVKGDKPTLQDFLEIISFSYFWHPIQKTIESRLKYAGNAATYLYRFDFKSNKLLHPYNLMYSSGDCGVAHTAELSFLFGSVLAKPMERQSREYQCLQHMISLWTQFAETGNPNGTKSSIVGDIKWQSLQRYSSENDSIGGEAAFKCLNINDELTFIVLPEMEKLKVWKSLHEIK